MLPRLYPPFDLVVSDFTEIQILISDDIEIEYCQEVVIWEVVDC